MSASVDGSRTVARTRYRLPVLGLSQAVLILVGDQVSKALILARFQQAAEPVVPVLPSLNFVLVANHGVSFGLLSGGRIGPLLFAALALAVSAMLTWSLWRTRSPLVAAGLGLIIGGALGNMIDRLRFGSVVDFIDFYVASWHWYVFNLADAAICIGVGFLLLDGLLHRRESPKA